LKYKDNSAQLYYEYKHNVSLSNVNENGAMCASEIMKNVNVGGARSDLDV
jgi:hypothetical protein